MKTKKMTKLAYEAPETSVDVIETEQCIMSVQTRQLQDMDWNSLGEDDDFDD